MCSFLLQFQKKRTVTSISLRQEKESHVSPVAQCFQLKVGSSKCGAHPSEIRNRLVTLKKCEFTIEDNTKKKTKTKKRLCPPPLQGSINVPRNQSYVTRLRSRVCEHKQTPNKPQTSVEKKTLPRHQTSQCHNVLLDLMCHFVHSRRRTDCYVDMRPFFPPRSSVLKAASCPSATQLKMQARSCTSAKAGCGTRLKWR